MDCIFSRKFATSLSFTFLEDFPEIRQFLKIKKHLKSHSFEFLKVLVRSERRIQNIFMDKLNHNKLQGL